MCNFWGWDMFSSILTFYFLLLNVGSILTFLSPNGLFLGIKNVLGMYCSISSP